MDAKSTAALQWLLTTVPLSQLLLLYWILAAGSVVATLLPIPVPRAFKDAVRLSACRGKLWEDKPAALGPLQDWSVPQGWFLHFYLLGALCNAVVLAVYCCSLTHWSSRQTTETMSALLCLLLFQLHLIRRAYETGLIMQYPPGARMHGVAYLFGLSYYLVVPLSLLPSSWYQQQQQQWQQLTPQDVPWQVVIPQLKQLLSHTTVVEALGVLAFLVGNVMQHSAHTSLAALSRGRSKGDNKEQTYKLPTGGMFEFVSCPHYLAEIIIYSGLVLLSGGKLMVWLMFIWVALNLALAAGATHKWYRRHFKQYPAQRRALIPIIY